MIALSCHRFLSEALAPKKPASKRLLRPVLKRSPSRILGAGLLSTGKEALLDFSKVPGPRIFCQPTPLPSLRGMAGITPPSASGPYDLPLLSRGLAWNCVRVAFSHSTLPAALSSVMRFRDSISANITDTSSSEGMESRRLVGGPYRSGRSRHSAPDRSTQRSR